MCVCVCAGFSTDTLPDLLTITDCLLLYEPVIFPPSHIQLGMSKELILQEQVNKMNKRLSLGVGSDD